MPYYPYPYVAAAQYQQPSFQYQPQRSNQQPAPGQKDQNRQYNRDNRGRNQGQNNRGNYGKRTQYDKIPVPYTYFVPYLIHVRAIVPKEIPQVVPPYHYKHNPNASCAYHAGHVGHSTEDYWPLKNKIQDLINRKILTFSEENPNVKTNPLPNHDGPSVSVVIEEEPAEPVKWVDEVKTSFSVVLRKLEEFGFLEGVHSDCSVCESDPDGCEQLRECVQELMNQGLVQFSKSKAAKEVANTKAVPWNYETTTYLGGKEIRIPDTEIVNIAGAGGMTRSGRVFSPKYTPMVSPAPTVVSPKEKATPTPTLQAGATVPATPTVTTAPVVTRVINNDKVAEAEFPKGKGSMVEKEQFDDHKKSITFEESQEFLKLIRKSDFKIVEQLNQTPSKISILSLLLSSEAHRKALLKVLNTAHVMQDITVDQFDDVVANIIANRYLGFNEAELPPEGKARNKALHISVTCTDSLLSRVLIDIGSSLNVLPKSTFRQL
ncbi:uncharacterized protein LOC127130146 [Lathyrus oleraceus]|uniref:uncharacterized protein LOC127130146 n=1 Tax=Pisum sativum TaxID=3888 RepID=UPI0021D2B17B|nr:uncharacterized protein LOC127130146 [Pisum sativum]